LVRDHYLEIDPRQGGLTGSNDFVGGQYFEFQTHNAHGNCLYIYLKSISELLYIENPYSGYLDLQRDIRAEESPTPFWVFGPYNIYTCHNSVVSRK
jgi:hypothetical protein